MGQAAGQLELRLAGGVRGKEGKRETVVWSREGNLGENVGPLIRGGNSLVRANAQMAELLILATAVPDKAFAGSQRLPVPGKERDGEQQVRGNLEGAAVLNCLALGRGQAGKAGGCDCKDALRRL